MNLRPLLAASYLTAAVAWTAKAAPPLRQCRGGYVFASAATPVVELLQILPMMPPLSPGTEAMEAMCIEAGKLTAPVWLESAQSIALLDRGQQLLLGPDSEALIIADGVRAHAPLLVPIGGEGRWQQGSMLASSDSAAGTLRCVSAEANANVGGVGTPESLPLMAPDALTAVGVLAPLSDGRLLVGSDGGSMMCLSLEEEPMMLLDVPGLLDTCVSEDGRALYLCTSDAVYSCSLDLDGGRCSAPEELPVLPAGASANGLTIDVDNNLYICTTDGVLVCDDRGDLLQRISTPVAASGACFGGPSLSELYVTAGESLWRLKTNTQGVRPPSPRFLRKMDQLGAGQIHEAW